MSAEIDTELEADQDVADPPAEAPKDEWDEDAPAESDDATVEDDVDDVAAETDEGKDEPEAEAETETEALDELEAEELAMLTDDESSERISVDEAAELRDIRRAELALDRQGADDLSTDEFVCQSCFLVLKTSQLAGPRKRICKDCAA